MFMLCFNKMGILVEMMVMSIMMIKGMEVKCVVSFRMISVLYVILMMFMKGFSILG